SCTKDLIRPDAESHTKLGARMFNPLNKVNLKLHNLKTKEISEIIYYFAMMIHKSTKQYKLLFEISY
ncbi:hypothetical protein BpHYR1_029328, partial [Brachionus plicatilis]